MFGLKDGIQHIPAASGGNKLVLCGLLSVAGGSRRLVVVNRANETKTVGEEPVLGRCLEAGTTGLSQGLSGKDFLSIGTTSKKEARSHSEPWSSILRRPS